MKALIDALPKAADVTLSDEEAIAAALKAYDGLTDDQKTLINDATLKHLMDAKEALDKLKAAKEEADKAAADAVTAQINALPKAENVKLTDEDAIVAARKAYDKLTDDQKKLVSAETVNKLIADEAALKNLKEIKYAAYEGEGGEYRQGSDGTLAFVFKRSEGDEETFNHFTGLKYDGKVLTRDRHYIAKSGSVVITLDHDLLESMEAGKHTLTAEFDDGSADAHFTVIAKGEPTPTPAPTATPTPTPAPTPTPTPKPLPKTGDNAPLGIWIGLVVLGLIGVGGMVVTKKRGRR